MSKFNQLALRARQVGGAGTRAGQRIGAALVALAPGLALADGPEAEILAQQTKALLVCAAFLTMGIAVWGGMYLYRKFFK